MAESHTPADNIVYDLVSIQYHALKAGQAYASTPPTPRATRTCRNSSNSAARRTPNAPSARTTCSASSPPRARASAEPLEG
jgi:hypothetical protein